ncbi:hypothetical protein [Enterocloster lavalensis]|uniref:hypothetical protein n=1 Tax=Enterocloster lavalensis TaxID=460384 RepID=UPI0034A51B63
MAACVDKPKEVNEVIKVLNDPGYDELQEENTWLRGSLREARRGQESAERMALMFVVLFTVSGTLLALICGGVIVV